MKGIYIHIPFCVNKCIYCDFYSETDLDLTSKFIEGVLKEITLVSTSDETDTKQVDTIYFGGGTPSVLPPKFINMIIEKIQHHYHVTNRAEITIEVNPGTVNPEKLTEYKQIGINRLNAGIQSFQEPNLKFLNRIHSAEDAHALIHDAEKAGFDNIGIDLMYCIPNQSDEAWRKDLKTAVNHNIDHLSCYTLTYEPNTPLYRQYEKGLIAPLDDHMTSRFFTTTMEYLGSKGFVHYEISNFARSHEKESKHNKKYWDFVPYTGFGPSAHSYNSTANKRYWNVSDLNQYLQLINNGVTPVAGSEILTPRQQMVEAVFIGLRKTAGICIDDFNKRFKQDFNTFFKAPIIQLKENQIIDMTGNRCFLTKKGLLLADRVTSMFVDCI